MSHKSLISLDLASHEGHIVAENEPPGNENATDTSNFVKQSEQTGK